VIYIYGHCQFLFEKFSFLILGHLLLGCWGVGVLGFTYATCRRKNMGNIKTFLTSAAQRARPLPECPAGGLNCYKWVEETRNDMHVNDDADYKLLCQHDIYMKDDSEQIYGDEMRAIGEADDEECNINIQPHGVVEMVQEGWSCVFFAGRYNVVTIIAACGNVICLYHFPELS